MSVNNDFGTILVSGYGFKNSIENANNQISQFTSLPVKGDGFLHRNSGTHTMQVNTINFSGTIAIEATIQRDPSTTSWISVPLIAASSGNTISNITLSYTPGLNVSPQQLNNFYSIVGQYTWLRANVSNVTNGTIESIKLAF